MENPKNAPMLKLTNKVMRGGASPAYQISDKKVTKLHTKYNDAIIKQADSDADASSRKAKRLEKKVQKTAKKFYKKA